MYSIGKLQLTKIAYGDKPDRGEGIHDEVHVGGLAGCAEANDLPLSDENLLHRDGNSSAASSPVIILNFLCDINVIRSIVMIPQTIT